MEGIIKQILESKGHDVTMVDCSMSLFECAKLMNETGIGSLLVLENEQLCGVLHERDISRRGVCQNLDMHSTAVSEVMNSNFPVVTSFTPILSAMALISTHRVRHLPVVDDSTISGLVSIGDLTQWVLELQQEDIEQLLSYINNDFARKEGE